MKISLKVFTRRVQSGLLPQRRVQALTAASVGNAAGELAVAAVREAPTPAPRTQTLGVKRTTLSANKKRRSTIGLTCTDACESEC